MQNPPPNQQPYGTPQGAPPPPAPKASIGMEPNLAAALSYIWIVGLVFFFIEKENKFIRFHAMQSVLMGASWIVTIIVLVIVNIILALLVGVIASAVGDLGVILGLLLWLISFVVWTVLPIAYLVLLIFAAVKAYQGKTFKIPVIGKMAEKIAG